MNLQRVFSNRIGGVQFGAVEKTYKFTLIGNKKREYLRNNPGKHVLDLGLGEPDEAPQSRIVERLASEARIKENLLYPFRGPADFRQACARYVKRLCNVELDPETEIIHVGGAKGALATLPYAFLDPGDALVATSPSYPVMPTVAGWLGARVIYVPLRAELGFLPDLKELEDAVRANSPKLLLLNYPNNPTGGVATAEFYKAVIALAHQYSFAIVQDAPYAEFVYNGRYVSPFEFPGGREVTIEVHSFSKTFNMQGFRIGFIAAAPKLLKAYATVRDTVDSGQFIPVQKAAMEAIDTCAESVQQCKARYRARHARAVEVLRSVGIPAEMPAGGPYLFCKVPSSFDGRSFADATEFCCSLVDRRGVATIPFDFEAGAYFRLSMMFDVRAAGCVDDEDFFTKLGKALHTK